MKILTKRLHVAAGCMILAVVLICACASGVFTDPENPSENPSENSSGNPSAAEGAKQQVIKNNTNNTNNTIKCIHYTEYGFYEADAASAPYELKGNILAATSPHFMPVMNFTASILKTVAKEGGFDTVFVVAPNHEARGLPFTATYADFETAFGTLETDKQALDMLLHDRRLKYSLGINDRIVEEDHSASSQMPFIKYYLPDVQVVPLLISKSARTDELEVIAEAIHEIGKNKKIFLLCSLDFSHYEPIEKTPVYDKETESAILNEDIDQIRSFDNAHVDSPGSLYVFSRYGSYFSDRKLDLMDGVIMPESEMNRAVGYSYYVYMYTT